MPLFLGMILLASACSKSTQQAFRETEDIKKNGLVFRLQDDKRRIEYFEKQGLADRAKAEKAAIGENNRKVVEAFQREFDFSPIHFYYASQQEALLAGKPVLLNSQMVPDAAVSLPEKIILASFASGEIEDNTHKWKAFRVVGSTMEIRPTYRTSWFDRVLQPVDVRRINRALKKMNEPKNGVNN